MAQQALTVQAASGGRFVLGIGLSHQMVIEGMFGLSFEKPLRHMREYLSVLMPLLHDRKVAFAGETMSMQGNLGVTDVPAPPVLIAALGPKMLELAGTVADGTVTWMTGPTTLASHTVPTITAAAERAGRPAPRIFASLPICITEDPDGARERAARCSRSTASCRRTAPCSTAKARADLPTSRSSATKPPSRRRSANSPTRASRSSSRPPSAPARKSIAPAAS